MDGADRIFQDSLAEAAIPSPQRVWEECGRWIKRTAFRIRERARWADIDDLVQQGVVAAIEVRPRYRAELGIPYLAFAKPRVFGAMMDSVRRTHISVDLEEVEETEADPAPDAAAQIIAHQDLDGLAGAIDTLPDLERNVISLFYLEELSNRDIAKLLALTDGAVTKIRQRALASLASAMAKQGGKTKKEVR